MEGQFGGLRKTKRSTQDLWRLTLCKQPKISVKGQGERVQNHRLLQVRSLLVGTGISTAQSLPNGAWDTQRPTAQNPSTHVPTLRLFSTGQSAKSHARLIKRLGWLSLTSSHAEQLRDVTFKGPQPQSAGVWSWRRNSPHEGAKRFSARNSKSRLERSGFGSSNTGVGSCLSIHDNLWLHKCVVDLTA